MGEMGPLAGDNPSTRGRSLGGRGQHGGRRPAGEGEPSDKGRSLLGAAPGEHRPAGRGEPSDKGAQPRSGASYGAPATGQRPGAGENPSLKQATPAGARLRGSVARRENRESASEWWGTQIRTQLQAGHSRVAWTRDRPPPVQCRSGVGERRHNPARERKGAHPRATKRDSE